MVMGLIGGKKGSVGLCFTYANKELFLSRAELARGKKAFSKSKSANVTARDNQEICHQFATQQKYFQMHSLLQKYLEMLFISVE